MPRIAKWTEKNQCIKPNCLDKLWKEDLERKYVRIVGDDERYKSVQPAIQKATDACVKAIAIPPFMMDRLKELPQQYSYMTPEDKCSIFNLIEDVISANMKSTWMNGDFLTEFTDTKEVPYGRYNSDSDYRGS